MTNKEAIDYLAIIYERSRNGKRAYHNKYQDAFDMAIEALKIEPCDDVVSRKAAIEAVEFGITYAKAIDVNTGESKELFKEGNDALKKASERIKDLPSAQPEPCGDVVSRNAIIQKLNTMDRYVSTELRLCDTDKKFPQNEVFIVDDVYEEIVEQLPSAQPETHEERTETHGVCLDAIDRQVAINALHDEIVRRRIDEDSNDDGALDEFDTEDILRKLPPAQPEVLACGEGELSAQSDIVRCEDCRHWKQETFNDGYCIEMDLRMCDADFYCGYAERRTDVNANT